MRGERVEILRQLWQSTVDHAQYFELEGAREGKQSEIQGCICVKSRASASEVRSIARLSAIPFPAWCRTID